MFRNRRNTLMTSLCVLVAAAASGPLLAQQDACVALIQHGIYATHVSQTSTQSYQEFRSNFCSWYASYRQSHTSAGASVAIPIVDIPIGLSGNMTRSEERRVGKECRSRWS